MTVSTFATADLDSLTAQLTVDEARRLTTGVGWWRTAAIDRLDIPAIKVSDGPNGVRGELSYYGSKALSLPCATALGSTWDVELIQELGQKIMAPEARLRATSVILAPTVNIQRSPLGGRSFESFSEDPHLSGTIASAYVNSIQNEGIACTIKHFVCNDQENNRHGSDSIVTPRALREIYLMPFMIAERDSQPWSYMTAYNKLNGVHCSENYWLLTTLLREEWGSKAMVMSDWYGVYSLVRSLKAGMDLEMPGENGLRDAKSVDRRLLGYKLKVDDIKACSKRVLGLAQRLASTNKEVVFGEDKEQLTYVLAEQRALLRRAAAQSIVLLRNEGNLLPLDSSKVKKVAVIGPNAKQRLITGGGSAEVIPLFVVSPLEGIEQAFGKDNVTFVEGCRSARHINTLNHDLLTPDGSEGWRLEFYNHDATDLSKPLFDCDPLLVVPALTQTRVKIYSMQVPGITEQFSVKFKAFLKPQDFSAEWDFSLVVVGRAKLWIDGKLVVDLWDNQTAGETFYNQGTEETFGRFYVEKGRQYEIEVLYNNISPLRGYAPADLKAIRLGGAPVVNEDDELKAAEKAAAEADVAIVVVGLNHDWESEGHDRTTLALPARTNELVTRVLKANPKTIVVNQSGSAVTMPWADEVPAILQAWYAGNSAGDALADVITGVVNPSAKLSLTFPRALEDIPSHGHFGSKLGPVRYAEDLWVGYKHFVDRRISPLWSFGFGLSYTTFEYSDLKVSTATVLAGDANDVKVELSVKVTNTGSRIGSEVVQVYVSPPTHHLLESSPSQVLKGFARVKELQPGGSGVAKVVLNKYAFSLWEENKNAWLVAKGTHKVLVAASSVDVKLEVDVMVEKDAYWTGL